MKNINVKCINPTKYLIKDKVYVAKLKTVWQGPMAAMNNNDYGERYLIKIHDHLTLTVSPKRFKIV